MKKVIHTIGVILLVVAVLAGAVHAKDVKFQASLDRNVLSPGQSVQLHLQFEGSSKVPALEAPEIEGFQTRYAGPSTRMSIVNGRMSSSVTHIYRLVPLKTGKFEIGPFSFEHDGDTYTSNALTVEVLDSAPHSMNRPGEKKKEEEVNIGDRVFVKMHVGKTRLFMNEITLLTIKLYVNGISMRDIQYPEYFHDGFSNGQFEKPRQYKEASGGTVYEVVEFRTMIFATREGEFTLGPAKVRANLVTQKRRRRAASPFDDFFGRDPFDSFFGNYEAHPVELKSEEISLTVLPLPLEGKPRDFKGAVGNFNFSLAVSPSEVTVGDPVTLNMIISGEGNFHTVNNPVLQQHEGFKMYEPQIKQEENRKVFEQVLIPTTLTVKGIPPVSFSFFNTDREQYQTIVKRDIPLTVLRPEMSEEIAIIEGSGSTQRRLTEEKFGRDIIYIKESPGTLRVRGNYLYNNNLFLLLQLVPVLVLLSLGIIKKRKQKLSSDIGYARRLSAPGKAKKGMREAEHYLNRGRTPEFYDVLFRTIREYIGDRCHIPSGGITADVADDILKAKGLDQDILRRLKKVFRECDMARYAPSELGKADMQGILREGKEIIDHLERHKG